MENNFELNVPGWYEVELQAKNDWLNQKLDTQEYGIWYTVKFAGDATEHLWQTKTDPVVGEKYWGHFEMTKSGKSTKFKKDKLPEGQSTGSPATDSYQKNGEAITASMTVKLAFQAFIQAESMLPQEAEHWRQIEYMADMLFGTINRVKEGTKIEEKAKTVFDKE